jgi:hypothetical protein
MRVQVQQGSKVLVAVVAGLLVWVMASLADVALLPLERTLLVREVVANFIGGLMAIVVILAIELRYEGVHYRVAMDRAAIISELNHDIRNAVLPVCIALQKTGDPESNRIADQAIERINLALRDATADALARRIDYTVPEDHSQPRAA